MISLTTYYLILVILSLLLTLTYLLIYHKHFDIRVTLMFCMVPIINFGYLLVSKSTTLDAALIATKITHLGGCYLTLLILLTIIHFCNIKLNMWLKMLFFLMSSAMYLFIINDNSNLFYTSVELQVTESGSYVIKEYGPMHILFFIVIGLYFSLSIAVIIYALIKKNQVSRKTLFIANIAYSLNKLIPNLHIEFAPATYILSLTVLLIVIFRMYLYEVDDSVIDSIMKTEKTAFVSFDMKYHYLGSNEYAKELFPKLNKLIVDKSQIDDSFLDGNLIKWVKRFEEISENNFEYEKGDKIYLVVIRYILDGKKEKGYQIQISDDTQNKRYIKLINSYNDELKLEVLRKTDNLALITDRLIMGVATMIEGRDNSTGGHIKRTSQVVSFLIDEMKKENEFGLSVDFCEAVVKASPMHDLGKITIDDVILRKPGKFTPEEYEVMKTHAEAGAKIIKVILEGTTNPTFTEVAINMAHFHHERYDGSGYPMHLVGDDIPLEARILAIADVYDALVSKRVYKEKMTFVEANKIILEGMGTQFDKRLEKYYVIARPRLEEYYQSLGDD